MNVHKMKLLQQALQECPQDAWDTYKRIKLVRRGKECPALCAFAARLDLQQDYKLVHDAFNGTVWRDDGTINWQLAKYFGVDDQLIDAIFGGGSVPHLAPTPQAAAAFVGGIIKTHEELQAAALKRVEKTTQELMDTLAFSGLREEALPSDESFEMDAGWEQGTKEEGTWTEDRESPLNWPDEEPCSDLTPTPPYVPVAKFDKYNKGGK